MSLENEGILLLLSATHRQVKAVSLWLYTKIKYMIYCQFLLMVKMRAISLSWENLSVYISPVHLPSEKHGLNLMLKMSSIIF